MFPSSARPHPIEAPAHHNGRPSCSFLLESASVSANALQPSTPIVRLKLVCNIHIELKKIEALLKLGDSPLVRPILRPRDFPLRLQDVRQTEYKGFVSVNK